MEASQVSSLTTAIRDGTFPDSDDLLNTDLNSSNIAYLGAAIRASKKELQAELNDGNKTGTRSIDDWVNQARKVEADIADCKESARIIVEEHERLEALRESSNEARNKVRLLEDEVSFNRTLQDQIDLIKGLSETMTQLKEQTSAQKYEQVASELSSLPQKLATVRSQQTRSVLAGLKDAVTKQLDRELASRLDNLFAVTTNRDHVTITLRRSTENIEGHTPKDVDLNNVLEAYSRMDTLQDAQDIVERRLEQSILPNMHRRSQSKVSSVSQQADTIQISLLQDFDVPNIVRCTKALLQVLAERLPPIIQASLVQNLSSKLIPTLISQWLETAIPVELSELLKIEGLEHEVRELALLLKSQGSKEAEALELWIEQIPDSWLTGRRIASIDAVRKAFEESTGTTRIVVRVELASESVKSQEKDTMADRDDWSDNWDDSNSRDGSKPADSETTANDESDAWGFDEEQDKQDKALLHPEYSNTENDDTDAWGWQDDEDKSASPVSSKLNPVTETNGNKPLHPTIQQNEPQTMKETYTITDIPDLILSRMKSDISVIEELSNLPQRYFPTPISATSLSMLPNLTLSTYRAIAPTYYPALRTFAQPLTPMNIFNDTLYLISSISAPPFSTNSSSSIHHAISQLRTFSNQIWTQELHTQRDVLTDLLSNAESFQSCTHEPFKSACDNAILSTLSYLRSLHEQYSAVLSQNHSYQAIGSYIDLIMRQITLAIQDKDDISEPESRALLGYCEQVSGLLEEIFSGDAGLKSVNVPSWLRFGYLQQILAGSLADIRSDWTEAGLSLEFGTEEVVDFIVALFAESAQRREAIRVIRGR